MTDDDCTQDEHTVKSKKAELQALIAKTARDLQALEKTERQQQLERRRENVAEYSASGKTLVPASPSPRKEKTKKVFTAKDGQSYSAPSLYCVLLMFPIDPRSTNSSNETRKDRQESSLVSIPS